MSQPTATEDVGMTPPDRLRSLADVFRSEAEFRAFYDLVLPRVYGYLVPRCGGDRTIAEELTQETFVAAIRDPHSFDGRADPTTWLIGIARHKLLDHYRRREREERRHFRLVVRELTMDPDANAWHSTDERAEITRILASMPTMQQAVLVLHYGDGIPIREVAARLSKSEMAIESLMSRARETFRKAYGSQGR